MCWRLVAFDSVGGVTFVVDERDVGAFTQVVNSGVVVVARLVDVDFCHLVNQSLVGLQRKVLLVGGKFHVGRNFVFLVASYESEQGDDAERYGCEFVCHLLVIIIRCEISKNINRFVHIYSSQNSGSDTISE